MAVKLLPRARATSQRVWGDGIGLESSVGCALLSLEKGNKQMIVLIQSVMTRFSSNQHQEMLRKIQERKTNAFLFLTEFIWNGWRECIMIKIGVF